MTKMLLLVALLFAVAACSTGSQYPQILQNTMAQSMPPYH
jgi:hypothetical protein